MKKDTNQSKNSSINQQTTSISSDHSKKNQVKNVCRILYDILTWIKNASKYTNAYHKRKQSHMDSMINADGTQFDYQWYTQIIDILLETTPINTYSAIDNKDLNFAMIQKAKLFALQSDSLSYIKKIQDYINNNKKQRDVVNVYNRYLDADRIIHKYIDKDYDDMLLYSTHMTDRNMLLIAKLLCTVVLHDIWAWEKIRTLANQYIVGVDKIYNTTIIVD